MKLKPYKTYEYSGAAWINMLPRHWKTISLRRIGTLGHGSGFPISYQGENNLDFPFYKVKSLGAADNRGIIREVDDTISLDTAKQLGAKIFPKESLVFATVGAALMLGRVRQLSHPACIDNNMSAFMCNRLSDSRFVYYAMNCIDFELLVNPGAVPSVSARNLMSHSVSLPPLDEQQQIALFLDRETAKIDELIAKQTELIATLRERRAALIDQTIERLLATRKCVALKYALNGIDQGVSPQAEARPADVDSIGVLKSGCVNNGTFSQLEHKRLPQDFISSERLFISVGDLLVSRASGSPALLGSAAIVKNLCYNLILSDKIFRLRPINNVSAEYLYWFLNCGQYRKQVSLFTSGAAGLANNLPLHSLLSFRLPLPPLSEQREIAAFLDRETAKIDTLIAKTEEFIELSRERRSALISAAVTGQIDVRDQVGAA